MRSPDVGLLDLGMPNLNGFDTCRRIRELPWGRTAVIVAVTGWGSADDRRRTTEAGFDHHFVKPIEYTTLMRVLG
jgi:CheY-like chemotaxis protein